MSQAHEIPSGGEKEPDGDPRIFEFLRTEYPDVSISDTGLRLMSRQLLSLKERYGDPDKPTYRTYHNDEHTFDTFKRSFRIFSLIAKALKLDPENMEYEVLGLGIMWHDDILEPQDGKTPELQSAEGLARVMEEAGYAPEWVRRGFNIVMGTEVRFEAGKVFQTKVIENATDPLVVSAAIADIAGILFEGGQRLVVDVPNLSLEKAGEIQDLLKEQYSFMTQRLADIARYITTMCGQNKEKAKVLLEMIQNETKTDIEEALAIAKAARDHTSEFQGAIEAELANPAESIRQKRAKISKGIITAWRQLRNQSSPE